MAGAGDQDGGEGGGGRGARASLPTVDDRGRAGTGARGPDTGAGPDADADAGARAPEARPPGPGAAEPLAGGAAPGRYRRGDEIGRGGMGRVVEAVDTVLGRTVAVKEIRELDGDLARRFEREVQVTARLEHPSIVPVYDAGRSPDGLPFYVMRRVTGRPLDELIGEATDLDGRLALIPNLLAAVDAVAHAHNRGVLHRDLKPGNVLVGDHGETLVIDWGLAKLIGEDAAAPAATSPLPGAASSSHPPPAGDSSSPRPPPAGDSLRTRFGTVFGTPGFMAPEQALGLEVDPRGDVYALGATLYYLLAGKPPWAGTAPTEILDRVVAEPPPPVTDLAPGAPADLVAIVEQAMAHDRDQRYRDAGALGDDLRRFLRGQLVAAHSYSRRERLMRWLRANRTAIAVGTAAAVALILLGTLSLTRILRDRDRIARAQEAAVARAGEAIAARDSAEEQRDGLLIENARAALDRDPTFALARLGDLRIESPRWPAARAVAAAARARGIAVAYPGQGEMPWTMMMSPDGTKVAVATRDPDVFVHDLVRRTTTTVAAARPGATLTWLGERLALAGDDGVTLVDLAAGTRALLRPGRAINLGADPDGTAIAWVTKDQRAFVSDGGEPVELPADDGPIDHVQVVRGGSLVVARSRSSRVLVRDGGLGTGGRWRVLVSVPAIAGDVTLADDGSRYAVRSERALREWEVTATGATPGRTWPLGAIAHVFYAGDRLMVEDIEHQQLLDLAGTKPRPIEIGQTRLPLPITRLGDDTMALAEDDELVLTATYQVLRIPMPEAGAAISARPGKPFLAVGTSTHVLVWDLREVWPERVGPFSAVDIVAVSARAVLALGFQGGRVFDTDGGRRDLPPSGIARIRFDTRRGWLVQIVDDAHVSVVDSATAAHTTVAVANAVSAVGYGPRTLLVLTAAHDVIEVPIDGGPTAVVAHLDAPADWLVTGDGRWAALAIDRVWRGDGAAVTSVVMPTSVTTTRFTADGTLYLAAGADLLQWPPGAAAPAPLARIEAIPTVLEAEHGRTLPVIASDRAVYLVDLDTGAVRQALPASQNRSGVASDGATAAGLRDDRLIHVADLTTGERWSLPTETTDVSRAVPDAGGRWLYVIGPLNHVFRYPIDLPRDPAELRRWILGRTNGKAGGAGLVEWQLPTPAPVR